MPTTSKPTKNAKPMVQLTQKPSGVYLEAQEELRRLAQDDGVSRKVDKALEEARGKDTLRLHVALHATSAADVRAQERHDSMVSLSDQNTGRMLASIDDAKTAILDDAAEAYNETIDLAESNHAAVVDLVTKSKAELVRDVKGAREDLLNGQAVLGESVTAAQKAAQAAFDALNKSVKTVYDSLAKSQESDGQAIMNLLREQNEATINLVQTIYNDLDTKMKHFREEMSNDIEKLATTVGNQNASVRGDMSVVLSLLSDVRKDQIGRPERR